MTRRKAENVFPLMAVFILIGPLVGLVVCSIGLGLIHELEQATARNRALQFGNALGSSGFLMFFGFFVAHKTGVLAAAIAGVQVGGYAFFWSRVPLIFGGFAGAVSYASTIVFPANIEWIVGKDPKWSVTLLIIIVHVFPSIVCTRLTRYWQ
jgi:hypothetical protein